MRFSAGKGTFSQALRTQLGPLRCILWKKRPNYIHLASTHAVSYTHIYTHRDKINVIKFKLKKKDTHGRKNTVRIYLLKM